MSENYTRRVIYGGEAYRSLQELCCKLGIDTKKVRYQIKGKGLSLEQAIQEVISSTVNGLNYNGKMYKNLMEICKTVGVDYPKVHYLFKTKGIPLEKAIPALLTDSTDLLLPDKHYYNGKGYRSVHALCRDLGIHMQLVSRYMHSGLTLEEAVNKTVTDKNKREEKTVTYEGKEYVSLKSLCKDLGLNHRKAHYLVKTKGIPLEKVISALLTDNTDSLLPNKHYYNGKGYPSLSLLCKDLGIHRQLVTKYVQSGLTLEEAVDKTVADKIKREGKTLTYRGKEYPSLYALCSSLDIGNPQVTRHMKSGLTLEEAIEKAKANTRKRRNKRSQTSEDSLSSITQEKK